MLLDGVANTIKVHERRLVAAKQGKLAAHAQLLRDARELSCCRHCQRQTDREGMKEGRKEGRKEGEAKRKEGEAKEKQRLGLVCAARWLNFEAFS